MPKMKTKRAAAKRFSATGTGKLKRNKAFKSHILTKKTTKIKKSPQGSYDRRYKREEHEEDLTISLMVRIMSGGRLRWQELKAV